MAQVPINRSAKRRKISLLLYLIPLTMLIVVLLFNFYPVKKIPQKPFFENSRPLVIAHQGGELLAPSNTMAAFDNAANLGVDVLETDLHITKDGHLVAIHDASVDRTTNGKGLVADLTLKEIQSLDAGYYFKDLNGNYSFRGKGVYIPTAEEIFKKFGHMRIEMEIKDDNPDERLDEMNEKLWVLIKKYHMEDKILVASFDQNIISSFTNYSKGKTAIAAGSQEVRKFVIFHKFFLPNLYSPRADVHQIPTAQSGFDLTEEKVMDGAKRRGQNIHYWTIDDKATMKKLLSSGADGILTNRPDLLLQLVKE
ncbi:glycerophosphoryl diester phosphodiesterase [Peribacillus deserti]|uniref:Glycerophosphoryl diester phosphodiesterase n=1 Tax=Peribacillus deserti TaxID=673318 RepID=A0ABS2QKB3_9BACI|nr:glycerophosphodiester phosphodiesterase [Peribacillus deserti]MBM7693616.1 glycerophosphoryl diester phosphodiesterase [Peribacillus deserti]